MPKVGLSYLASSGPLARRQQWIGVFVSDTMAWRIPCRTDPILSLLAAVSSADEMSIGWQGMNRIGQFTQNT